MGSVRGTYLASFQDNAVRDLRNIKRTFNGVDSHVELDGVRAGRVQLASDVEARDCIRVAKLDDEHIRVRDVDNAVCVVSNPIGLGEVGRRTQE